MFKKTLIASALTVAAMNASAVVVSVAPQTLSTEGSANEVTFAQGVTTFVMGAEYTVNDIITLTVSNGEFDSTTAPALGYTDTSGGNGNGTMTLGLLSSTSTAATFRITDLVVGNGDAVSTGDTLTLTGVVYDGPTIADNAAGVVTELAYAASATGSGLALDTGGTTFDDAFTMTTQYASSVTTPLDAVVDVNLDSQDFVGATGTDSLVITPTEAAPATTPATYDGAVHVISGDFSFIDADLDGTVTVAELNAAVNCTATAADTCADGTHALNTAMNELTVTALDGGGNAVGVHTIALANSGQGTDNAIVDDGAFTSVTTVNYTPATGAADTSVFASETAGAWTLNGANFTVPYIPFGTNTQAIFRITNTGTDTGALTVAYVMESDATNTWKTLTNVANIGPGVTNVGGIVMDAIIADSGDSADKVAVEITINAPDADISAFVGFKVQAADSTGDGSRTTVGTFGELGDLKRIDK